MMMGMVMLFGSRFHIPPLYRVESLPSQIHQQLSRRSPPSLAISYKRPTSIAICTLSKSERGWTTLHDSYVYQFFLQGVSRSTRNETEAYLITLHVGVDGDDRYWQKWGQNLIETAQLEFGLSLFLHNYNHTQRYKLPFNNLMRDAAASGADYLVRLNDDTEILSHGWISRAIKHLLSYRPPNIGVVGPACKQDSTMRGILTHDMVHRTHLDIFENYYPERFNNWYIDDWITEVYKPKRSTILDSWTVHHHTEHGMRYRQSGSPSDLKLEVALGKSKITKFLRKEYNFSVDQQQFGMVVVDIRKPEEKLSFRIRKLLQQILSTKPDLQCELWISPHSTIDSGLQDFIHAHKKSIFIRYMPVKFDSNTGGYSIDLLSDHGGHIGKAMALRESIFSFPVLFDGDSWPCKSWFDIVLNASRDSDIIWSLAPIPFGASINRDASACTSSSTFDQISKYKQFPERNTGTIFAVRQSAATYTWLTDAMIIRANMSYGTHRHKFLPYQDQAAFREAFFLHRHQLREHLVPSDVACRQPAKFSQTCNACLCQCSSCVFAHGKNLFDQCAASESTITRKTQFSNKKRFIFVAGLEGTGHHFLGTIFRTIDQFKVLNSDPIRCHLMQIDSTTQFFDLAPNSHGYQDKKQLIINKLRTFSAENSSFSLFALNTDKESGKNCMSGMMSYPNGLNGKSWPDIRSLAHVAEEAGVDLRIIVLTRPTIPMIQSVSARFRSIQQNINLVETGANMLVKQLDEIDPAFFTCVSYDDLHGLINNSLHGIQNFLVPKKHQPSYNFIAAVQSTLQGKHRSSLYVNVSQIIRADHANHKLIKKCDPSQWKTAA